MGFRSHGDVVRTDLICSVHFHEKHTIRVYLAWRRFPLKVQDGLEPSATDPREAQRGRPEDKRDRRWKRKKKGGAKKPPSGGRSKHSAVCSAGMNFHHPTLFIAQTCFMSLYSHQVKRVTFIIRSVLIYSTAYITQTDILV